MACKLDAPDYCKGRCCITCDELRKCQSGGCDIMDDHEYAEDCEHWKEETDEA